MAALTPYHASDGTAYQRFLGRWTDVLAEEFVAFARLPGQGKFLDVGCGTGSLALAMARRIPDAEVAGTDIAEPYLEFARRRPGAGKIRFEAADAASLPFADGEFSAALAQLVLNFVPDAAAAAREMRRVTQPGGVVAASVWDFRGGLVFQRLFWDTAAGIDAGAGAARDRLFSGRLTLPDGLVELMRGAGLRDIERGSLTIRMAFENFDDYWEPLLGGQGPFAGYVAGLAPALREQVREAVRAAFLSGAPDGVRSMTATAWAVRGIVP